ncbi:hypothetical protein DSO57_1012855 [Entomophthora muscae]|uniref:Uncharacterized protein n=1 Tax=Entomophthora muscae TaxID=34485 RepID=A0ACC2RWZ5_9FUNG|nr:hypothetical protein DSO57_1012855 [Entomophthora muscae]
MNKKSNSNYIVDPNRPHFPFKLINPRKVCSRGPSPDHGHTPPPMKRTIRRLHHPLRILPYTPFKILPYLLLLTLPAPKPTLTSPPSPHLHPAKELLDFDDPTITEEAAHYNVVLVETAPNTPPSSPGPSDFLLQEINGPEAHSSQNAGANQSEAACNSASHVATGAANERASTSGVSHPEFLNFVPNLEKFSDRVNDSPLVSSSNQSVHLHASAALAPSTGANEMASGNVATTLNFPNANSILDDISNSHSGLPLVFDGCGSTSQLEVDVPGCLGLAYKVSTMIDDDDKSAYFNQKQANLHSRINLKAGPN